MRNALLRAKRSPAYTGFVLFIIVLIINLVIQTPFKFFSMDNISLLFAKNTPLVLVTMGQLLLMLLGIIDISIGVQMSLANVLSVMLPILFPGMPLVVAWLLAFGAVVGIATLNGVIVSYLRIPPLLAGFAMIYIVKGLNLLIMPKPQGSVPEVIYKTYDSALLGVIPFSAVVIVIAVLIWMYLKKTPVMRHVIAVGGNERNAYATGINTQLTKVKMYAMAGVFTAAAGLCLTAMSGSGNPIMGEPYGLRSICACILGGVALAGGWGTMACALYGSGFLILIQNTVFQIFNLLPQIIPGFTATTYWQNLVSDGIILLGLVATVFTIKAQRDALKEGITKQIKRGGVV